ncbi:cytochrome P450 [Lentzea flava]|uniref:Cytochrome P450 BJ-3 n=1 Tax=Lentzea flava TaxID=103732 RepID=A0ABQ2UB05_9PSEU|nr:cytochrome P450 [Lentzea flava]MCP2196522.1 Cytochrome P450 [Lentzea flava]GGU17375.1 cytochrome P450 BJ-3 [Lentzea flava]
MSATIDVLGELAKPEHRQDPYPFLHWLRENDPVHRTRCGCYLLSSYDDVAFALRQTGTFAPGTPATAQNHPGYARLRAAIARELTPARVLRMRPRILEHLGNVFDDLGPRLVAGETVDLHAEVSVPLTRHVFADLSGLISRLVEAHDDEPLITLLWTTGYESTVSGIDCAVLAFLAHPGHRSWCGDDPAKVQRFLDEALRHDGVVLCTPVPRIASADVELGGVTIPAGASVRMLIAAANRDPRAFRDPDTFDPARDPRRTLSTGNCCGTTLGRATMAHVLTGLRQRFPTLVAAAEPAWSSTSGTRRAVEKLPARLV